MLPTLAEVLQLPDVRRAGPRVVAGERALSNSVRWVHVSELPDIAHFLQGGELLLTTGLVLPNEPEALTRYVRELVGARLSCLMVELGRNFNELPVALIRTAEAEGLPLVALTRDVPFVKITEAVNSLIVNERLTQLQFANEVHRTFVTLSMDGGSMSDVLKEAATLLEAPIVFEGLGHQVIAFESAGERDPDLLTDWESRSRRVGFVERTQVMPPEGWLVTRVGARGETWGRLIVLLGGIATEEQAMVAEWAATTLVLNRLVEKDQARLDQLASRNLLSELLSGDSTDWYSLRNRLQAAGVPTRGCKYIGLTIYREAPSGQANSEDDDALLADRCASTAKALKIPSLAGVLGPNWVSMLVVASGKSIDSVLRPLATKITGDAHNRNEVVTIGVGRSVGALDEIRESLLEANRVTEVASSMPARKLYFALSDVHLRGLLHALQTDSRLQDFVEREIGSIIEHDRKHDTDLLGALSTYLDCGQNVSAAAAAYRLSRPAYYSRLRQIEELLGANLGEAGDALSLYVAITAMRMMGSRRKLVRPIVNRG